MWEKLDEFNKNFTIKHCKGGQQSYEKTHLWRESRWRCAERTEISSNSEKSELSWYIPSLVWSDKRAESKAHPQKRTLLSERKSTLKHKEINKINDSILLPGIFSH